MDRLARNLDASATHGAAAHRAYKFGRWFVNRSIQGTKFNPLHLNAMLSLPALALRVISGPAARARLPAS